MDPGYARQVAIELRLGSSPLVQRCACTLRLLKSDRLNIAPFIDLAYFRCSLLRSQRGIPACRCAVPFGSKLLSSSKSTRGGEKLWKKQDSLGTQSPTMETYTEAANKFIKAATALMEQARLLAEAQRGLAREPLNKHCVRANSG
jgi:hypothetical protein